jgi:hypothetical protein
MAFIGDLYDDLKRKYEEYLYKTEDIYSIEYVPGTFVFGDYIYKFYPDLIVVKQPFIIAYEVDHIDDFLVIYEMAKEMSKNHNSVDIKVFMKNMFSYIDTNKDSDKSIEAVRFIFGKVRRILYSFSRGEAEILEYSFL